MVRPAGTGMNVNRQQLGAAPREDLDLRHETRGDTVTDEVGQALLDFQRVNDAADAATSILDANEQRGGSGRLSGRAVSSRRAGSTGLRDRRAPWRTVGRSSRSSAPKRRPR